MTCDFCARPINYCFYINDAHWLKVVGEERFDKNQGVLCAHCTLERLGGLDWYIIWNKPAERARINATATETANGNLNL